MKDPLAFDKSDAMGWAVDKAGAMGWAFDDERTLISIHGGAVCIGTEQTRLLDDDEKGLRSTQTPSGGTL